MLPELTFWHGRRGKELDGALWGLQMESRAKHLHLGLNGVRGSLPEVLAMRFGDKARRGNGEQQRPRDTSFKHSHKRRSETPGRSTPASGSSGRAPRVGAPTQTPGHGSARLGASLAASPQGCRCHPHTWLPEGLRPFIPSTACRNITCLVLRHKALVLGCLRSPGAALISWA